MFLSPVSDTSYSKAHKTVIFTVFISICLHMIFLYYYHVDGNDCQECDETDNLWRNFSVTIKERLPPAIPKESQLVEPSVEPLTLSAKESIEKSATTQEAVPESKAKIRELNYSRLTTSVQSTINQLEEQRQQAFYDECLSGISNTQQDSCPKQKINHHDDKSRFQLGPLFARAFSQANVKAHTRKLMTQQNLLISILENNTLSYEVKNQLQKDLYYLRSEMLLADCNGVLNSGDCAGEIDVIKLISNLGKVIKKLNKG